MDELAFMADGERMRTRLIVATTAEPSVSERASDQHFLILLSKHDRPVLPRLGVAVEVPGPMQRPVRVDTPDVTKCRRVRGACVCDSHVEGVLPDVRSAETARKRL